MIETQYMIHTPDLMQYRVRPHPDHENNEIVLVEWKEADQREWQGEISFARQDAIEIARCLLALANNEPVKVK